LHEAEDRFCTMAEMKAELEGELARMEVSPKDGELARYFQDAPGYTARSTRRPPRTTARSPTGRRIPACTPSGRSWRRPVAPGGGRDHAPGGPGSRRASRLKSRTLSPCFGTIVMLARDLDRAARDLEVGAREQAGEDHLHLVQREGHADAPAGPAAEREQLGRAEGRGGLATREETRGIELGRVRVDLGRRCAR
jgi:hypothetical protein